MKLAKVVRVHPRRNKVDLLCLDDGRRMPGVRVMAHDATFSSGTIGLAKPDAQDAADPYDTPGIDGRHTIACVSFYGDVPVVVGFLYPEVSEMFFPDQDRVMVRTPSDFYSTVDGKANAEWYHPSGAYVRIAEAPEHEDLTGKDYDKQFSVARNTGRRVHIHIEQAGGVAFIDIDPDGHTVIKTVDQIDIEADKDINISSQQTINVNAQQNVNVTAQQDVNIHAKQDVTISADDDIHIHAKADVKVHAQQNAEVSAKGFCQVIANGETLVRSKTRLTLKGPSNTLVL